MTIALWLFEGDTLKLMLRDAQKVSEQQENGKDARDIAKAMTKHVTLELKRRPMNGD